LARSEIHLTEEISGRRMPPIALCSCHLLHRLKERCSCSQSEGYPCLMVRTSPGCESGFLGAVLLSAVVVPCF
jgi:hypothetical protein